MWMAQNQNLHSPTKMDGWWWLYINYTQWLATFVSTGPPKHTTATRPGPHAGKHGKAAGAARVFVHKDVEWIIPIKTVGVMHPRLSLFKYTQILWSMLKLAFKKDLMHKCLPFTFCSWQWLFHVACPHSWWTKSPSVLFPVLYESLFSRRPGASRRI